MNCYPEMGIPAVLPAWLSGHVVTHIDQIILYIEPGYRHMDPAGVTPRK